VKDGNNFMELEQKSQAHFAGLRSEPVTAPPYLKTRVLAGLREKRKSRKSILLWRGAALFSTGFCAILLFVFVGTKTENILVAEVGTPQAIRLNLESDGEWAIAEVEIVLPNGVKFFSKRFPEMENHKSFRLAFKDIKKFKTIPFVVQVFETGQRTLLIRIYDSNGELKKTEELKINFAGGDHA